MNSIKTLLIVALATLPFIACSQNTPVVETRTEVVVQPGSTLNAKAIIPGLSIQVSLPAPAWNSVASGHVLGTDPNNVTAITLPKGLQIKMVLNENSKPIAATWTTSNPQAFYVWGGTGLVGRMATMYAGNISTITATAADGRSKSFTVYGAGMTADPAPSINAGARNIFVVRPDGKIVVSGSLLGAGIPNANGYTYDTAIVPNNTGYVATSCESGADFVVCRTTNPRVVLLAGIDTNMLGRHFEGLTAYELPGTLLDVAAHFYTTVFAALVNGNHYVYSGGMNANGQLANGQPRTTSGRSGITLTGGGLIKLNSSEKISLGYFWNGEAWVSGDYGGFALRYGGSGSSLGWDRANFLDHWQSVTHDENLFCGLGLLRTQVLMLGIATGWECGLPGNYFPGKALDIPNGEIGVRIAKGRGFAVLMTEQNVYYSGILQFNGAPQCYGWCKVPVPGVPLEIDAKGFTNIIKTTTGVYTIQLGTLRTLNLYPEAVGVSFDINPTSISQLVHSTSRVKVATVGFGANDFTATSSHPDVTLEQIYFEGKALLVHCLRPISSTINVTLTHNVFPLVTKILPVTCRNDQAPTAALSVPSQIEPFKDTAFSWKYGDADSSVEKAQIEVDGNLIWDVYGTLEGSRNHQFSTVAIGNHTVCLVVVSRGLTTRSCKNIGVLGSVSTNVPPPVGPTPTTNRAPTIILETGVKAVEGVPVSLGVTLADPDGDSLTCRWDLDSDGTPETPSESCGSYRRRLVFPQAGIFSVKVTVSDGRNAVSKASSVIVSPRQKSTFMEWVNSLNTFSRCILSTQIPSELYPEISVSLSQDQNDPILQYAFSTLIAYWSQNEGQYLDLITKQFKMTAEAHKYLFRMTLSNEHFAAWQIKEALAKLGSSSSKYAKYGLKALSPAIIIEDLTNCTPLKNVTLWDWAIPFLTMPYNRLLFFINVPPQYLNQPITS